MASEIKLTTPPSVSVQSVPEVKLHTPHFPVCDLLERLESNGELDDTNWLDYVSQYADRGVR